MRKLLSQALLVTVAVSANVVALTYQPTIPTRAFDVRNGNGVVDAGTTYSQAIVIVFKDKAAKDEMIEAFAAQYNYQTTVTDPGNPNGAQIPNPQSKAQFANKQITAYLRDIHKAAAIQAAVKAAQKAADDAAEAKLPSSIR